MPWNGSGVAQVTDGVFTGTAIWTQEKGAANLVTAAHFDNFSADLCTMLQNCQTVDGQTIASIVKIAATTNATTGVITIGGVVFANLKGTANVFVGNSGNFSGTGTNNVGLGNGAFANYTSATQCVVMGLSAAAANQDGSSNVVIGYQALSSNVSGNNNVAIGTSAATGVNGNNRGVWIGTAASGGDQSVAIGYAANAGTLLSSNNTCVGYSAGTGITSGGSNVVLGLNVTNCGITTGSFNTLIGTGAAVANATANGQINLACTIFGTGATTTGSGAGTGKIGINNPAPTYELECGTGDFGLATVGKTLRIKEAANGKQGTSTLVAGSKVVSNTSVTANSRIFVTSNSDGGAPGWLRVSAKSAGASFTVTSSSGTDTSTFAYLITEPY